MVDQVSSVLVWVYSGRSHPRPPDMVDPSVDFDLTVLVERICFERMENFFTDVYHKPMDPDQYLNSKFCHPPHVKKAIP